MFRIFINDKRYLSFICVVPRPEIERDSVVEFKLTVRASDVMLRVDPQLPPQTPAWTSSNLEVIVSGPSYKYKVIRFSSSVLNSPLSRYQGHQENEARDGVLVTDAW